MKKNYLFTKNCSCYNYISFIFFVYLSIFLAHITYANINGNTTQNFNPTSNAVDFVTVYSSKTVKEGSFSLGLFLNSASNSLPYFKTSNSEYEDVQVNSSDTNDVVVSLNLGVSYGVMKDLDVSLTIPAIIYQYVKVPEALHGEFNKKGITDIRFGAKYILTKAQNYALAALGSINLPTIKGNPYDGSSSPISVTAEIITDILLYENFELAGNLGFRFRNVKADADNQLIVDPYGNQIIFSTAAAYLIKSYNSKVIFEMYSAFPTKHEGSDSSGRSRNIVEGLLGVKLFSKNDFIYSVGLGREITHSIASPSFRFYAGLNYLIDMGFTPITNKKKIR